MEKMGFDISIVGAGNMAFRLGIALRDAGHNILRVWCRKREAGEKLASILASEGGVTSYTDDMANLLESQVVIIAVSDNGIGDVAANLASTIASKNPASIPTFFHTSGATHIDSLKPLVQSGANCGVLYPMMTLSKNKSINFNEVPLLIEYKEDNTKELLEKISFSLRCEHFSCDSAKRLQMHCAAVFASNFVNYALSLAFELAGEKAPYLIPTAIETVRKCCMIHPDSVQTGPALRGDTSTMEKHLSMLREQGFSEQEEIYRLISKNIPNRVKKR